MRKCVTVELRKGGANMTQCRSYVNLLHDNCKDIPEEELLDMANSVDSCIGGLLYFSFVNSASYETIEKQASLHNGAVPASRRTFYRKRKQYINLIERRQTAAGMA